MTALVVELVTIALLIGVAWVISRKRLSPADGETCANCGYDLRASSERCPECGMPFRRPDEHIPLRDDWPADAVKPRIAKPNETAVVIHATDIQWEAQLLAEQLRVRGVEARVTSRPVIRGELPGYGPAVMGSWRVIVWSGDADIAAAIRDKLIPPQNHA